MLAIHQTMQIGLDATNPDDGTVLIDVDIV